MSSLLDTLAGVAEHPITLRTGVSVSESAPAPSATPSASSPPAPEVIRYDARTDPQAEDFLAWLWKRMKADDLVDLYFPGQSDTGFTSLVEMFSKPTGAALFKLNNDSDQWNERIPGFITWSVAQFGNAPVLIAGFIFFKDFWDGHTTTACGRAAFDFWFRETKAEIVLGLCPSLHIVAQRYNKRVGLREMMRLPNCALFKGAECDAIVYGISRADWQKEGA